jgi:VanZ family protein
MPVNRETMPHCNEVVGSGWQSERKSVSTWQVVLAWASVLLWFPTSAYLTLADSVPGSLHDGLDSWLGHVIMGLAVTATALVLLRVVNHGRRPPLAAVGVVVAASALFLLTTEFLQSRTETRTPSWADVAADLLGVTVSTMVVAGPFEPRWIKSLRRGPVIPVIGVVTAAAIVITVAGQPRFRDGMALDASGCIERLEHIDEPSAAADPATDVANDVGPPLLTLDLTTIGGTTVDGQGGGAAPVLFEVIAGSDARTVEPTADGMAFDGGTAAVRSREPVTDLIDAVDETEAFTVTMVFTPETLDQEGPARLLTISEGTRPADMNLQIGIHYRWLSLRIRSACDTWNWMALSSLPEGEVRLAVTYDNGTIDAYINGLHTGHAELEGGDIGSWEPARPLVVGNEVTLNRGFLGTIGCAAIRDVAIGENQAVAASTTKTC